MIKNIFFSILLIVTLPLFYCSSILAQDSESQVKAISIENWETGDFSQYDWQFEGDANWQISDVNPYEGEYSAMSMDISDNQSAALYLEYDVYGEDTLSFWYKVSSENNYDYLKFYVNDVEIESWSGEIQWTYFEMVISVGTNTFKWEYDKDYSVSSGQDAVWIDMITFPPAEVEALFMADTTIICDGDSVHYTDLSIGPITEWSWNFEGAVPSTSTEQSPVINYPNVGQFDVTLEVTDGVESAVYYQEKYINVSTSPEMANSPLGISFLCASWGNTTYSTLPMGGDISHYDWALNPPEAGTISGNGGTNIIVVWDPDFLGIADLHVAGINYCGTGIYSAPLSITRYLPNVAVMLPAYVALPEPAFELTGGTPAGGEYSGNGVANGWFDPSIAGMGPHTITYTYTDLNQCTSSATDVITVTEFIGIDEKMLNTAIQVFPNPGNGNFALLTNVEMNEHFNVTIYNALSDMVYEEKNVQLTSGIEKRFELNLTKGIYFIRISGSEKEIIKKIVVQK